MSLDTWLQDILSVQVSFWESFFDFLFNILFNQPTSLYFLPGYVCTIYIYSIWLENIYLFMSHLIILEKLRFQLNLNFCFNIWSIWTRWVAHLPYILKNYRKDNNWLFIENSSVRIGQCDTHTLCEKKTSNSECFYSTLIFLILCIYNWCPL